MYSVTSPRTVQRTSTSAPFGIDDVQLDPDRVAGLHHVRPRSPKDRISGQRLAGGRPLQISVMASTAASLSPLGRNMPYQVEVASILKPQVKAKPPRQRSPASRQPAVKASR